MDLIDTLIDLAFQEDIGPVDVTTECLISAEAIGTGDIIAKEALVLAGLETARKVFSRLDPNAEFETPFEDGDRVAAGQSVLVIHGRQRALLMAERIALNFMQRLSGIATQVRSIVNQFAGFDVRIVDTRKTTPGWRVIEKYAVRVGGGTNHRMGLYDGVLIKDNHIAAVGGIQPAVSRVRNRISHLMKIEVEVSDLGQVREALTAGVDIIMLDNMNPDQIRKAMRIIDGQIPVEVSGGVRAKDLPALVKTGVQIISIGALTHSVRSVDMSMRFLQNR
jgi:nicotinate-nucleotide pyrophosphorylase (carboxylating)